MTATTYNAVYYGKILDGFNSDQVKHNLIQLFSLSEEKAEHILKSKKVVLKKNVAKEAAEKYRKVLARAGIYIVLETSGLPPTSPGPADAAAPSTSQPSLAAEPLAVAGKAAGKDTATGVVAKDPVEKKKTGRMSFMFTGNGSEYFRIWIVNILLSIVTLGIYSAWAKVRRKQYFYGNTKLDGTGFEYLADPLKILKGRAIVFVVFVVYSIVANLLPIIGKVLGLAFFFVLPWLVVRSLSFNARNSSLRNIRFGFDAGIWDAAKVFVLLPIAALFTLGILGPYVFFRQRKFVVEHSSYGTTRFNFFATHRDYYRIFLSLFLHVIGGIVIAVLCSFVFPPLVIIISIIIYLYTMAYISVKTSNLFYNSSSLAGHTFEATMIIKQYIAILFSNTLATALTVGLFYPWAAVRTLRYKIENLTFRPGGDIDNFVADELKQVSALGDEMSDFLDFDFGL